ncbi:MAG: circularly permuted type 2 ATP-grasp protein, partial [Actinomycetota bacterium]
MTLEGLRYAPAAGGFDEVFDRDGSPRVTWAAMARALGSMDPGVLRERQRQADRLLDAEGTGHLVHELSLGTDRHGVTAARSSRPWRLDPIPFVLAASEFQHLAAAATQRMRVLEALLIDCYGPRHLVADGLLPASLLNSLPSYRPVPGTAMPTRWLLHYSLDLVRDADGGWHVVRDATDTPRGLGYA